MTRATLFQKYNSFSILVHLSRRLKCTIVITRCPSVVRPSSVTFLLFDFFSETTERFSTTHDRKQDINVLYQVDVIWPIRKNKMATQASDWLRHFRLLLWNCWTKLNEVLQEAKSQCLLTSLCFSSAYRKIKKTLIGWHIFIFSIEPLNRIKRNLTGSKISMTSTNLWFLEPIGKQDGNSSF